MGLYMYWELTVKTELYMMNWVVCLTLCSSHSPKRSRPTCPDKDVYIPQHPAFLSGPYLLACHVLVHACELFEEWHCFTEKCDFPCFFCRVGDQTGEASYLVPEANRGLQECDDHRLDIFLEKWHRPLCPHPQVQTPADVRNTHQIISVPACRAASKTRVIDSISFLYSIQCILTFTWTNLFFCMMSAPSL